MNEHPDEPRYKSLDFECFQIYHSSVPAYCCHGALILIAERFHGFFFDKIFYVLSNQSTLLHRRWGYLWTTIWKRRISFHDSRITDREDIFISLNPTKLIDLNSASPS